MVLWGFMAMRDSWIEKREAAAAGHNGSRNMSQMHLARQGVVTEEMQYVAKREKLEPELVSERNRPRSRDYSRQYSPPQPGADGHRRGVFLQDQREHRKFRDKPRILTRS